mmetsp:Transcript_2260/g.4116  ORF Transcript_2260/g.4116 Transcript_2260/m.4116 type:complete len:113 (-) Transcript_2260:62-400(-)
MALSATRLAFRSCVVKHGAAFANFGSLQVGPLAERFNQSARSPAVSFLQALPDVAGRKEWVVPAYGGKDSVLDPGETPEVLQAVNTRKELRRWKHRRKRDGGKDRRFRLKYG